VAAGGEVNVRLGRGFARIAGVMRQLRKARYGGLIAIGYEHDGLVREDVRILILDVTRKILSQEPSYQEVLACLP
jgi:hypothetical protein